ncbi:DinB family protein [Micromonospora sp. NPDC004704]
MTADAKEDLHRYLREAREDLVWKVEGLSEHDLRRPLTPTGTNLLGLVKHLTTVELLYFGFAFGRNFAEFVPWYRPDLGPDGLPPNTDMWATADESREYVVELYQRVWKHSDATIEELALDATGHVLWWPEPESRATLHRVLAHVIAEVHRHVGHADIVRELVDGAVGLRRDDGFLPPVDEAWWEDYRNRLTLVAEQARVAEQADRN